MNVEAVDEEIITSLVNVFAPAKDCVDVETKPVAPVPAIGILNVCVDPEEDTLNNEPVVPTAKYCSPEVSKFKEERPLPPPTPVAVIATQERLPDVSDCKTDAPVEGAVFGRVYSVLVEAVETIEV